MLGPELPPPYLEEAYSMADADLPNPQPPAEEMHWGLTYLQNDLKEVKQDLRDLRRGR